MTWNHWLRVSIACLFGFTCLLYLSSVGFDYINFDDHLYTYKNPLITGGLTWEGIRQSFLGGTASLGIWFPLTMLSYMVDVFMGGVTPAMFHGSNIFWHALTTTCLFILLIEIVKSVHRSRKYALDTAPSDDYIILWASLIATTFWAWHPQRLESVVWISGRKDILSGLFAILTCLFYVRSISVSGWNSQQKKYYMASLLFFALAIMSKPVVMTLPLGLICLEWIVCKKISIKKVLVPCVMAFMCAVLSVKMQSDGQGDIARLMPVSLYDRLLTSLSSIAYYIRATVFPYGISIFHPWPLKQESGSAVLGAGCCLALGVLCIKYFRKAQFNGPARFILLAIWYLGALFPMLSLFVFGSHSKADRFTYYPAWIISIGLALILSQYLVKKSHIIICIGVVLSYALWTGYEQRYWKNTESVFLRAVTVYTTNPMAYYVLGNEYMSKGPSYFHSACVMLTKSIAQKPTSENMGTLAFLLATQGNTVEEKQEAEKLATTALGMDATEAIAHGALGVLSLQKQAWQLAAEQFEKSLRYQQISRPFIYEWRGMALYNLGDYNGAMECFIRAFEQGPTFELKQKIEMAQRKLQNAFGPRR